MSLRGKSIHELRAMAQAFGVPDLFKKDVTQLAQAIEFKQQEMVPKVVDIPPRPEYDSRMMTKPPSKASAEDDVRKMLAAHVERGLHLSFPEPDTWSMRCGVKTDTGSMRVPLRVILGCAERVMR